LVNADGCVVWPGVGVGDEVELGVVEDEDDEDEPVLLGAELLPPVLPPPDGAAVQLGGVPVCPAGQVPGVKLTVAPPSAGFE
jgi:hypothetical protein